MTLNRMLSGLALTLALALAPPTVRCSSWGYVPPSSSYYVDPATGATVSYPAPAPGVQVYGPGRYASYSPFYYAPSAVYGYGPSYYSFGTPTYTYTYPSYTTYYRTWRWVR